MIVLDKVSKIYGKYTALDEVSLTIPQGQVLGILGQNGAGKSTLLNIIVGFTLPTQGSILINNADVQINPLSARESTGFLPEYPPLYPEMTVSEYLLFCANIKGVIKQEIHAHIKEIIELTGLSTVKNRIIANLSKGFQQRTGLAQALCGTPDILILDEPTSGFDPAQIIEFRSLIRSLAAHHTIIVSSHSLNEISTMCDRIIILHQGKLVYDHLKDYHLKHKQFFVRILGESQVLLSALCGLSSVVKVKPIKHQQVFEANLYTKPEMNFETELFYLLSGLDIPILELRQMQDNLEDIFMNIISSSDKFKYNL